MKYSKSYRLTKEEYNYLLPVLKEKLLVSSNKHKFIGNSEELEDMINRLKGLYILGRGQSRGMWLEIDRLKPKDNYSLDNCVLCCYFCNNDKSDVFHGDDYREFQGNRVGYLRKLLNKRK